LGTFSPCLGRREKGSSLRDISNIVSWQQIEMESLKMNTAKIYQARRKKLSQSLAPNSIAIIASASECLRNGDSHYSFRQNSHFYYLTGFNEPKAILIILSGSEGQSILFHQSRNLSEEQWTGRRLGQEEAPSVLGVQQALAIDKLPEALPELLEGKTTVYYPFGDFDLEKTIQTALLQLKAGVRKGLSAPANLSDLNPTLSEMRLFKTGEEIHCMREAVNLSVFGHQRLMRVCTTMEYEYQLEAEWRHELLRHGCRHQAYEPIIASGDNACILHYTDNNRRFKPGDLILVDAGAEYGNYAADLTRTFPANGIFSSVQKEIYELVLKAQQTAIAAIKPGLAWNKLQDLIIEILISGLCDLGILHGNHQKLRQAEAYKPFYMHQSGHWLGLDVHDVGSYKINKQWRNLEPGMVLTVEPGLYLSANNPALDQRFWGIGVRIEDDILVTDTGHEILSAALAVTVDDIEALMRDETKH
jgi:Xaa-Pro aminopeptidase